MRKNLLYFLTGGFFYICLVMLWGRQYQIMTVQAKEIVDEVEENGLITLDEENEEDSDSVLSDSIGRIEKVDEDMDMENNSEDYTEDTERDNVSENQSDNEEEVSDMNDNGFQIMIIFSFGLLVGVLVGHFLTGFIK